LKLLPLAFWWKSGRTSRLPMRIKHFSHPVGAIGIMLPDYHEVLKLGGDSGGRGFFRLRFQTPIGIETRTERCVEVFKPSFLTTYENWTSYEDSGPFFLRKFQTTF
jgi:hypothetical protein